MSASSEKRSLDCLDVKQKPLLDTWIRKSERKTGMRISSEGKFPHPVYLGSDNFIVTTDCTHKKQVN